MNNNNLNIASWWKRPLAYVIDWSIKLLLPLFFVYQVSTSSDLETALNKFLLYFVVVVFVYPLLFWLLDAFMISKFGGTFGKLLTGMKIVSSEGNNVSFWRAFFRNRIGYMISGMSLCLGFIWILIDKERRAWHDMAADTLVVTTNEVLGFVGILILAGLIFTNYSLVKTSITNFQSNSPVYMDLYDTIKSSLQTYSTKASINALGTPTPSP